MRSSATNDNIKVLLKCLCSNKDPNNDMGHYAQSVLLVLKPGVYFAANTFVLLLQLNFQSHLWD